MVMFARTDIRSVHIGEHSHSRPMKGDNTPVPVWGIDCPPCEAALASDPGWSRSRNRVPLTPDEKDEAADAKAAAEAALHQQQLMLAQAAVSNQLAARGATPETPDEDVHISGPDESQSVPEAPSGAGQGQSASYDYSVLSKADLKDIARSRGLPVSGTSADLVARLTDHDNNGGTA